MPVEIKRVRYTEVLERADLLEAHYEELATDKTLMRIEPHLDAYAELDRQGALFALGAYDLGELVGYSVNMVSPALHYRQLVFCHNDVLFLAKSHRIGRTGLRLIAATEREAKMRGAGLMLWHAKQSSTLDALLQRKGYGVQDVIYSRGL